MTPRTMQTAKKSTGRFRAEKNLDDETHQTDFSGNLDHIPDAPFFSDDDEVSSDEGSDYEKCAWRTRFHPLRHYTHNFFYNSSEEKGQRPSSEEGEKRLWCDACQAIFYEGLQTEKESQLAPYHASRCPFRGRKIFCNPPTLTADRLFEVFSHLTPKDIIHLSRTSRIFRDTLMMKNATSVWKAARERCGAPECPSTMSEPQWAILLFGNLCQVCKRYGFVKGISILSLCLNDPYRIAARKTYPSPNLPSCVGFVYTAKRISKSIYVIWLAQSISKFSSFLTESKFKKSFPDVDPEVLELIPYTNG